MRSCLLLVTISGDARSPGPHGENGEGKHGIRNTSSPTPLVAIASVSTFFPPLQPRFLPLRFLVLALVDILLLRCLLSPQLSVGDRRAPSATPPSTAEEDGERDPSRRRGKLPMSASTGNSLLPVDAGQDDTRCSTLASLFSSPGALSY